jgi:acetyl esterase/lipase
MWPVTDAYFETESYEQYAEGRFLTRNMMKWFWDNYTTDSNERSEIYASPLRAMTEELQGLPPALVLTAGNDVLRDEGEEYARKLDVAGVDVTAVRYEGMIHDWGLLNPISQVPAVQASLRQVANELKHHLS